jgi:hypothetical protein
MTVHFSLAWKRTKNGSGLNCYKNYTLLPQRNFVAQISNAMGNL